MPHLSPIFWVGLYIAVGCVIALLSVSMEYFNISLKR